MKLLHLADLHIGKIIYDQSLLEDQEYMLNEIIKIAGKEKVDAVLISGDIYDRSVPPDDAVDLLNDFCHLIFTSLKTIMFSKHAIHPIILTPCTQNLGNCKTSCVLRDGLHWVSSPTGQTPKFQPPATWDG